jgi:uncharacterized peroxidase-related enzyme
MTTDDPTVRAGFLDPPPPSPDVQRLYDEDVDGLGYVMNLTRVWGHQPATADALFELIGRAGEAASLTVRQRGILITACASTLGDSYCSLAWGAKLADAAGDVELAAAVLRGDDGHLDPEERALAHWARIVARDPNGIEAADVQALRDAGFSDAQVVGITVFVALRLAFSTVNDALGATPDRQVFDAAPAPVRDAVTYGRPAD